MEIEILKENINHILMTPEVKILEIGQHMQQKSNTNDPDISFEKKQQKVHRNCIIRV